jgi:quercetin dioxygenase-like cupin family protein
MKVINENDVEYRFRESGPKYLLRGLKVDFGVVKLLPGEDFADHYHNEVEENFFILEGEIDFLINGEIKYHAKHGDLVHIPPPETHYLKNNGTIPAKAIFVKAPFLPKDKVNVDK